MPVGVADVCIYYVMYNVYDMWLKSYMNIIM